MALNLGLSVVLTSSGDLVTYEMDANVGSLTLVLTNNYDGTHNVNVTGTPAYYTGNHTIQTADLAAGGPIIVVQPGGAAESPAGTWTVNAGLVIYPTGSTLESTTRWYRADDDQGTNEEWTGDSDQVYVIASPADNDKRVYYREYHVVTESGLDVTSSEVEVQEETDFLADTKTAVNGSGDGMIILMDTGTWQDTSATTAAGNGDSVARIDDQSTHGNNLLQSTSANEPTLTVSGGLTYIDADGVNDYFEINFVHTGANFYIAAAMDNSIGDNTEILVGIGKNGWVWPGNENFCAAVRDTSGSPRAVKGSRAGYGTKADQTGISVAEFIFDATTVTTCVDGGTDQVDTHATSFANFDTLIMRVFASTTSPGSYWTGKVYGIVCMTSVPTSGERASIRGLLAQKSGATLS